MSTTEPRSHKRPPSSTELCLEDQEFGLLRELVHQQTGIALGPHKREMLKARLGRRLRALAMKDFADYWRFLCENDPQGEELLRLVNAVTTNVTEFFREVHHFRYLEEQWLPVVRDRAARDGKRRLRLWSAGCSTGEEPYSIAVTLQQFLGAAATAWDLRILASDIDTDALERARTGVYARERVESVPAEVLKASFLRGTGGNDGLVRVRPEVQALIAFRRINLMDEPWPIHTRFDAIFCRNVLIYFDRPTQQRLLARLTAFLKDDGLFFLGHSEGLHGLFSGMRHLQNTVYQRTGAPSPRVSLLPEETAHGRHDLDR